MPGMICSLAGLLTHAADEMERLHRALQAAGQECYEELGDSRAEYYIFCLREAAANCRKVTKGEEPLSEFGRFYLELKTPAESGTIAAT